MHGDDAKFIPSAGVFFLELIVVEDVAADHVRTQADDAGKGGFNGGFSLPVVNTLWAAEVEDVCHGHPVARAGRIAGPRLEAVAGEKIIGRERRANGFGVEKEGCVPAEEAEI